MSLEAKGDKFPAGMPHQILYSLTVPVLWRRLGVGPEYDLSGVLVMVSA